MQNKEKGGCHEKHFDDAGGVCNVGRLREVDFWRCSGRWQGKRPTDIHSNNGRHDTSIRADIDSNLREGNIILFEEKNPIHTVVLLGIDIKGRYIVATNGRVVRRSRAGEIRKALHGMTGAKNQKNWWSGRDHGAGYVVIKG